MSTSLHSRLLRFESFTLDVGKGILLRDASELRLRRQSFEVLLYLAERAGRVVPRRRSYTLFGLLQRQTPMLDRTIIKEIRRALGSDGRWIIATMSGRGYEFHSTGHYRPTIAIGGRHAF